MTLQVFLSPTDAMPDNPGLPGPTCDHDGWLDGLPALHIMETPKKPPTSLEVYNAILANASQAAADAGHTGAAAHAFVSGKLAMALASLTTGPGWYVDAVLSETRALADKAAPQSLTTGRAA